jgi:hypothetical protein
MKEYKFSNAVVRIHGSYDQETLKAATEKFMKKVHKIRKQKRKEKGNEPVSA